MAQSLAPATKSTFNSAYILPITSDRRVLLTKEKRGNTVKYSMLGGSAEPNETDFECMARTAKEKSGGALSSDTLTRIAEGRGIIGGGKAFYENIKGYAVKFYLDIEADLDVDTRFDARKASAMRSSRASIVKKKKSKKPETQVLALEFVDMENVRNHVWRAENMHHVASVLTARLMKVGVFYC